MRVLTLYWSDLTKDAQKRLSDFLGGGNGNYDIYPLVTLSVEEEGSKDLKTQGKCYQCKHYDDGFCHYGEDDGYACIECDPGETCKQWEHAISPGCETCRRYKDRECEGQRDDCFYRKEAYEA